MGQVIVALLLFALAAAALKFAIVAGLFFYLIFYPKQTLVLLYLFVLIPLAFDKNMLLGIVVTLFGIMMASVIAKRIDD